VYGDSSVWHFYVKAYPGSAGPSHTSDASTLKGIPGQVVTAFQRNLQIRGADLLSYTGGVTSAAHTEEDIQQTIGMFDAAMESMLHDQLIALRRP
jgi:glutamate-1-semialdehyde 2,1-aminomutase